MGGGRQLGNPSSPATAGTVGFEYTKYLVGPTGRYATIQAAITAAVADGFTGQDAATQAVIWMVYARLVPSNTIHCGKKTFPWVREN
jgi:hypothetical protein